jgi:putative transposase
MPRTARASVGGLCYHVLNRGNAGVQVFLDDDDYESFVVALRNACDRMPMRVLAYCVLPDHFHLAVWPRGDGDLGRWMHWLLNAQVRRYHQQHHTSGHLWQGRFKAFPVAHDEHLLTMLHYIESNPVRARRVRKAERWQWSSARWWLAPADERPAPLDRGPVARPEDWTAFINQPLPEAELEVLRQCVKRDRPYGPERWVQRTAARLGLERSLRPRGRPPKLRG